MIEFLLWPLFWIARSYWAIIESDLLPASWLARLDRAVQSRAEGWSLARKLGLLLAMTAGGIVAWLIIGIALTVFAYAGWLSAWWVLGIGVATAYLLVGGSCAAFFLLMAGKVSRRRSR